MDLFAELLQVTEALDAAAIDHAVCGGVALAIHGAPRATRDLDLLVREADLPRVREAVRACGFTLEALPMTFTATGVTIHRLTKITADGASLMLNLLLAEGPLAGPWSTRSRAAVAGSKGLSVVSRQGLVTLKLIAGRPQDLVDVQRLEEVARGGDDA